MSGEPKRYYTDCGGGLCQELGGCCDACANAEDYFPQPLTMEECDE